MSVNKVIICIMVLFSVLGALDKVMGNKFGLGKKFEEGIMMSGELIIPVVGVIVLAPVLANVLKPVIVPMFKLLHADPAVFAGSILASDMGGASLAKELTTDSNAAAFGGLIIGTMLGPTISFTIPVALQILRKKDREYFIIGILAGIITIPIGAVAGGITAGFSIVMIGRNLSPIFIFAILILVGLWKFEKIVTVIFNYFGKLVMAVATLGFVIGLIQYLVGIVIIQGTNSISEGFNVVMGIVVLLTGAFPFFYVITKVFQNHLMKVGKLLGINNVAAAGMLVSLANALPMFDMIKDMDCQGKVLNIAFAVSVGAVFGDFLGFIASFNANMIVPVIVGKLTGGISAIIVAKLIYSRTFKIKDDVL